MTEPRGLEDPSGAGPSGREAPSGTRPTSHDDFRVWPDLAVRLLGGSVVYANDELFAARENLINAGPPSFDPGGFGPKGKIYDGWETRRRREPGHDEAIVRLGVAGVVRGVVVDTAWFRGNYPPEISVEAAGVEGYPSVDQLRRDADWETIVPRRSIQGDAENVFAVDCDRRWTHVRLSIYPDGGVARLRVHGEPLPDPRLLDVGAIDLAAVENGGLVVGCSNMFYGSPNNLLLPGPARSMGEGWETARRRDEGNDWVVARLAGEGTVRLAELDTSCFVGNAPGWATLRGFAAAADDLSDESGWFDLLPYTRLLPDTRHRFPLPSSARVTHVRLDIYPDGGMSRLRMMGRLSPAGRERAWLRWFNALSRRAAKLATENMGLSEAEAAALVTARPITLTTDLPPGVRRLLAAGSEP